MNKKPNGMDIVLLVAVIVLVCGALYETHTHQEQIKQCHKAWQEYYEQSNCFNTNPTPMMQYVTSNNNSENPPGTSD